MTTDLLAARICAQAARAKFVGEGVAGVEPLHSHPAFEAIEPAALFARMETLLARALDKTRLETAAQQALDRLHPGLRDCDLLLIELATNLFEGVRALLYQTAILTQTVRDMQATLEMLQQVLAIERQRQAQETDSCRSESGAALS